MHELKIAEDLASIVLEEAEKHRLSDVCKVNIVFGKMIQIVPDIFRFAFNMVVSGTIAENAEVNIDIFPIKLKCRSCGKDFEVVENKFACSCGSTDLEITGGKELFIKSIEGD